MRAKEVVSDGPNRTNRRDSADAVRVRPCRDVPTVDVLVVSRSNLVLPKFFPSQVDGLNGSSVVAVRYHRPCV